MQLDGFVAGDDAAAKAEVLELVRSIGLTPVDVGPLVRSRQLEGLAFLNIALNIANGGAWQSAWKLVGAPTGSRGLTDMSEQRLAEGVEARAGGAIPVARLNHAVLYVRDASAAADFYGRVFGFEVVENAFGGRAVFMRAARGDNHHDLGLFSVGPDAPRPARGSIGLYHLAWEVPTIDDLAHAAAVLTAEGALERRLATTASRSPSMAPTPTATNSRSCGAFRAPPGASSSTTAPCCRSTWTRSSGVGAARVPPAPDRAARA